MNRREVLKAIALTAPLTVGGRLYAAPWTSTRLLVVFLRGAYDAANVVVPVSSDFYYQSRPTLAIARPNLNDPNAALPLDRDWGLHPALKETLYPLYQKNQLAFVPFAGSDDTSRSHFETQDSIELGQALNGTRDFQSGFMSRLADQLTDVKPIAFTDQLPLIFRGGGAPIPNMGLNSVAKPGVDERQASLIMNMYRGTNLEPNVTQGFAVRDQVYETVSAEMRDANRSAVMPRGFELAARRIANLMNNRFNLGFVDVGGWDTHVNQGAAAGYLATRLAELGRGLSGFAQASGPAWNDTVVIVISEFGRTFRENGDRGTDHGHGSPIGYWAAASKAADWSVHRSR
jgi:uncharacterized protein (DUF1501 family)